MTAPGIFLKDYTEKGSEVAFRQVVEGHVAMVYSTALRVVGGDAHLAQDVAQTVFLNLAHNAGQLADHPNLAGWLHRDTFYAASKAARQARRRARREQEAALM